eukprot:950717_1
MLSRVQSRTRGSLNRFLKMMLALGILTYSTNRHWDLDNSNGREFTHDIVPDEDGNPVINDVPHPESVAKRISELRGHIARSEIVIQVEEEKLRWWKQELTQLTGNKHVSNELGNEVPNKVISGVDPNKVSDEVSDEVPKEVSNEKYLYKVFRNFLSSNQRGNEVP